MGTAEIGLDRVV